MRSFTYNAVQNSDISQVHEFVAAMKSQKILRVSSELFGALTRSYAVRGDLPTIVTA